MTTLGRLRRERLLSQTALALRAGCSVRTVVLVETGRRAPQFETIRRLAAALGVEPAEVWEFRPAMGLPADDSRED